MYDVFISYSHRDEKIREAVVEKLESAGIRCWYAPRDIRPGVEWADAIISGLKSCRILLLIFTEAANASNQVLREVGLAVDFKKTIIPFKCDETIPSGGMQYYLSTLHWMDSSGDRGAVPDELPALVREKLSEKEPEEAPAPAGSSVPKKTTDTRKMVLWIVSAILVLNIGLGIFLYKKLGDSKKEVPAEAQQEVLSLETLIAEGVTLADGGDIRSVDLSQIEGAVINNKLYYFTTDFDSPGADDYLYTLMSDNTIELDDYKGEKQAEIVIPEVIDGLPVTDIGDSCFEGDDFLEKVTMPDTIDYIGASAFAGCTSLKEAVFSNNLKSIDKNAFLSSGLTGAALPDSLKNLETGVFYGCTNLETVSLPENVKKIQKGTFQNTPGLKTVTIAAEKVMIDKDAFDSVPGLTLIGVPGSYTENYAGQRGLEFEGIRF